MIPITLQYQKPNANAFLSLSFLIVGKDRYHPATGSMKVSVGEGSALSGTKTVALQVGSTTSQEVTIQVRGATLMNA